MMHYCRLESENENVARRALAALRAAAGPVTSRELCRAAKTINPGTVVSMLRAQGVPVSCERRTDHAARMVYYYSIEEAVI